MHWRSGSTLITSTGDSRIAAIHLDGRYDSGSAAAPGHPAVPPSIAVTTFEIDGIDATSLSYRDTSGPSPLYLDLGRTAGHRDPQEVNPLHINRITLHDFVLPFTAAGTLDTAHLGVQGDITGLHIDGRILRGAISRRRRGRRRLITVGLSQGGNRITAHGYDVTADAIYRRRSRLTAATRASVDGSAVRQRPPASGRSDTGDITVTPTTIEIAGMHLPDLSLTSLRIGWGARGYLAATRTLPTRRFRRRRQRLDAGQRRTVDVHDVQVDARIDRTSGRIWLRHMEIDHIDARGIELALPGRGTITLPVTALPTAGAATPPVAASPTAPPPGVARLQHIQLSGPTADGFIIDEHMPGGMAGTVHVDATTLPTVAANMTSAFHGNVALAAGAIQVDIAASGALEA